MVRLVLACLLAGLMGPAVAAAPEQATFQLSQAAAPAVVSTSRPAPTIGAAAGILLDARDGTVLWEHNSRARRAIASTTKILTALVVLEAAELDEMVTASARAEAVGADDPLITQLHLIQGERLSVEDLLYGLMLPSGSDAAVALAEHVGGSVEEFARLMTERARAAGATDSNFTNADGLDDPGAYSSAYDLAQITRAAMANAEFRKIAATPRYQVPGSAGGVRNIVNRNELLGRLEGATGVKTGNTRNAGRSLVASATRGDEERLSVILGSPDPFAESASILNFGFAGFRRFVVVEPDRPWGQITYGDGTTVELALGEEVSVLIGESTADPAVAFSHQEVELSVAIPGGLTVPLQMRCPGTIDPCAPPERRRSPLAAVIWFFSPLLEIFR